MTKPIIGEIERRLAVLRPVSLAIEDESHHHIGHAGAREGGHFRVTIVSAEFQGKNTVERHRLVYAAVGGLMRNGIHALAISAIAPGEV